MVKLEKPAIVKSFPKREIKIVRISDLIFFNGEKVFQNGQPWDKYAIFADAKLTTL